MGWGSRGRFRHGQGPTAGGETVTITEFSNGNGSADGRASNTARHGMEWHRMDAVMEPWGRAQDNKESYRTMALSFVSYPVGVPGLVGLSN